MDYERILSGGFDWAKDRKSILYIAVILVLSVAMSLSITYLTKDLGMSAGQANAYERIRELAAAALAIIAAVIVIGLIEGFFSALLNVRALELKGMEPKPFSVMKYIKLIALEIIAFFYALFSLKNKYFLWFFAIILGLFILGAILSVVPVINIFGLLLLFCAMILFIPYLIIVVYNSIRYSMAPQVFLHKKDSIIESINESYEITRPHVFSIFGVILIYGIIIAIIAFIFVAANFVLKGNLALNLINIIINTFLAVIFLFVFVGLYQQITERTKAR
ncbi:MAG: hypothetical protein AB1467_04485 [Candidatus Diapherotrites archaeon]